MPTTHQFFFQIGNWIQRLDQTEIAFLWQDCKRHIMSSHHFPDSRRLYPLFFSCSVVFDSLPAHGLQHASLSFTISRSLLKLNCIESVMPSNHLVLCCPLLLLPSFFPKSESFPMSQLFPSGGQSIRASASASVLPMNIQGWFPLFSLQSKGLSKHHSSKASILWHSAFFMVQLSHLYNETTGKAIVLTGRTFVDGVMSLLFNTLSGHSFSSKEQVSFKFMAAVTICSDFGAQENKVFYYLHCFPIYMSWSDGTRCHDLSFLNVEF